MIQSIGKTDAWPKVVLIHRQYTTALSTGYDNLTILGKVITEPAAAFGRRRIKVIPQAEIECQPVVDFPIILNKEPIFLRAQIEWTTKNFASVNLKGWKAHQLVSLRVTRSPIRKSVGIDKAFRTARSLRCDRTDLPG